MCPEHWTALSVFVWNLVAPIYFQSLLDTCLSRRVMVSARRQSECADVEIFLHYVIIRGELRLFVCIFVGQVFDFMDMILTVSLRDVYPYTSNVLTSLSKGFVTGVCSALSVSTRFLSIRLSDLSAQIMTTMTNHPSSLHVSFRGLTDPIIKLENITADSCYQIAFLIIVDVHQIYRQHNRSYS